MKSKIGVLILLIPIMTLLVISCTPRTEEYSIYDTATGRRVSLRNLAARLAGYDVVIFGEYHGNELIHSLQAELLSPYLKKARNVAISMEMFERDVQGVLDSYLEGSITEEAFMSEARAWPNYIPDYKPIIDFAQRERLYVIAANVPRRYAAMVNREGIDSLGELPEEERRYLAKDVVITDDLYKQRFYETMLNSPHLSSMNSEILEQRLFNLYAAQSLKDDTMAESIVNHIEEIAGTKVIHFTGDFHSRERLGMVTKIKGLNPELKIAVISPVILIDEEKFTYSEEMSNIADFIFVIKEIPGNE